MKSFAFLRWFAGVAIFALVIARVGTSISSDTLGHIRLDYLILALGLNAVTLLLTSLRSQMVLKALGHSVRLDVLFPAAILGFVAGSLTPAASGELLRAEALRSKASIPVADSLTLIAYERGLSAYLLAVTSIGAAALLVLPSWVFVVALLPLGAMIMAPSWLRHLLRLVPAQSSDPRGWLGRVVSYALRLASQVERLLSNPALLASWSLTTFGLFAVVSLQFWLLSRGVGADATFEVAWLAYGLSQLAGIASLLPFGIGVSDGSLAATLAHFGSTTEQAAAVALLVRLAVTLPLVGGALFSYAFLLTRGHADIADPAISTTVS